MSQIIDILHMYLGLELDNDGNLQTVAVLAMNGMEMKFVSKKDDDSLSSFTRNAQDAKSVRRDIVNSLDLHLQIDPDNSSENGEELLATRYEQIITSYKKY